jgi:phage-related minor tail protein
LQDYYNSVKDLGGAIGDAVVSGLKGLEDQLTAFVTTGKANFKELAASILSDLARIALRAAIIGPIVKAIGGLFPGFKFATGGIMTSDGPLPLKKYARGGIANSPQLAMFGEGSMPEAYVPLPDGRRIPVAMKGGGGGNSVQVDNITINVENSGEQLSPAAQKQIAGQVRGIVLATLVDQRRGGGVLR